MEQIHNLTSGESQDKKKMISKRKQDRKAKSEEGWIKKNCNRIFGCCSFHETKAKKRAKERKRQTQGAKRKAKRKDKKAGRKKRTRERQKMRK